MVRKTITCEIQLPFNLWYLIALKWSVNIDEMQKFRNRYDLFPDFSQNKLLLGHKIILLIILKKIIDFILVYPDIFGVKDDFLIHRALSAGYSLEKLKEFSNSEHNKLITLVLNYARDIRKSNKLNQIGVICKELYLVFEEVHYALEKIYFSSIKNFNFNNNNHYYSNLVLAYFNDIRNVRNCYGTMFEENRPLPKEEIRNSNPLKGYVLSMLYFWECTLGKKFFHKIFVSNEILTKIQNVNSWDREIFDFDCIYERTLDSFFNKISDGLKRNQCTTGYKGVINCEIQDLPIVNLSEEIRHIPDHKTNRDVSQLFYLYESRLLTKHPFTALSYLRIFSNNLMWLIKNGIDLPPNPQMIVILSSMNSRKNEIREVSKKFLVKLKDETNPEDSYLISFGFFISGYGSFFTDASHYAVTSYIGCNWLGDGISSLEPFWEIQKIVSTIDDTNTVKIFHIPESKYREFLRDKKIINLENELKNLSKLSLHILPTLNETIVFSYYSSKNRTVYPNCEIANNEFDSIIIEENDNYYGVIYVEAKLNLKRENLSLEDFAAFIDRYKKLKRKRNMLKKKFGLNKNSHLKFEAHYLDLDFKGEDKELGTDNYVKISSEIKKILKRQEISGEISILNFQDFEILYQKKFGNKNLLKKMRYFQKELHKYCYDV